MQALTVVRVPAKRARWRRRAASTRARTTADDSPGRICRSSSMVSDGASTWRSMRSRSGPLMRAR